MSTLIDEFFPNLSERQREQIAALQALYSEWNARINVISRRDIDNLYEHHVLHSLAIARFITFRPSTRILDLGCGGGFPGIPLAIFFPDCIFTLIDGTGKKVKVATEVAQAIGLKNVVCRHQRGEECADKVDFIVSRAVMPLPDLYRLTRKNIIRGGSNALPNGIITLKGGDVTAEVAPFAHIVEMAHISDYFPNRPWFTDKHVIYIPA